VQAPLRAESQAAPTLNHPSIYEIASENGADFIVMELFSLPPAPARRRSIARRRTWMLVENFR
jgi:hypothetical protein